MLSNSRVYILNVEYQNTDWLSISQTDQLSSAIANILKASMPDFIYKNIQFVNSFDLQKHCCQIHINKITYKSFRTLSKEYISELRQRLKGQLEKIPLLKFEQVHVVNDEFDFKSTPGLIRELS